MLRKTLWFPFVLIFAFAVLARPAEAFRQPVTVVDRTALTATYIPISNSSFGGISEYDVGLSYAMGPTWDLLLSYSSQTYSNSAFRVGGRYHLPPPNPDLDFYLTAQYASDTVAGAPATTGFLLGAGITQQLAPTFKVYYTFAYHSQVQAGFFDFGMQYYLSRQWAVVGGVSTGSYLAAGFLPSAFAYVGLNYTFFSR